MFSEFFLAEQHSSATIVGYHYVYWLGGLSYAVAAFASYTAFHLVERFIAATDIKAKMKWLAIGALSMGCGIWSMHFVAMLAVRMEYLGGAGYDVPLTALSAVFAIAASGFAFSFISKKSRGIGRLLVAGTILGAGIGAMHYTGMAAMRMDAMVIRYDPLLFGASIVVAVLLSCFALRLMSFTIEASENERPDHRLMTGLIMGMSITLMHYTGMAATNFLMTGKPAGGGSGGMALDDTTIGSVIVGVAFVLLGLSWLAASIGKRQDLGSFGPQSLSQ